jgi:hypothetical protein
MKVSNARSGKTVRRGDGFQEPMHIGTGGDPGERGVAVGGMKGCGNYEVTFAEPSPETSKVRIGREKPGNESSPTSRLTT